MKKRIFLSIAGLTLVSICIFSILFSTIIYNQLFEQAQDGIRHDVAQIKKLLIANNDISAIKNFAQANRITIIDNDGTVLHDSVKDPKTLDNHSNRPEILALQHSQYGESIRLSDTLGEQTYYYAVKLNDKNIVRAAITIDSIYAILFKTLPYLVLMTLAVISSSMLISSYLTRKIIAPLYNINEQSYDELRLFYRKIKKQQEYIENQKRTLEQKTEEFSIITENIADGCIVLNIHSEIVSINQKAISILGKENTQYISKNIIELNRSDAIRNGLRHACAGANSEITLELQNKQYLLHIAPIYNATLVAGSILLIVDNTKKADAERTRREFSANVSHELKTPLTSISGYAELMKSGLVKPEDMQKFSEKIYTESQNLILLINDIIKISKLDEESFSYQSQTVKLQAILEESIAKLEILAQQKNILITTELEDIEITGVKTVLEEAFSNILDNAIKYTQQDGSITVSLRKDANASVIKITDTGIGIPEASLDRIFERFYRVDTSHSKNIPGTGLGLAIVKHAIQVHKGTIDVRSELTKGTSVTISL